MNDQLKMVYFIRNWKGRGALSITMYTCTHSPQHQCSLLSCFTVLFFFKTSSKLRPQATPTHYFYFPTIPMGQSPSCLLIVSYNCCSQLLGVDGHNWNFENCLINKMAFCNFIIIYETPNYQNATTCPIFCSHWFCQISFFI